MKKSLINIMTLALSVANMVLMIILVFAIVPTMNNMNNLITTICTAIDLETANSGPITSSNIAIDDIGVYNINDGFMTSLKSNGDGKQHYMMYKVTISMNKKHEDFATYGSSEALLEREGLIRAHIQNVVASYTIDEVEPKSEEIRKETLESLQNLFGGSNFIIDVSFIDIKYQ